MYENLVSLLRKKYDQAPLVMEAADAIEELLKAVPDKPRKERIQTEQDHNEIFRWKEPGPDGMWSRYLVQDPKTKAGVVIVFGDNAGLLDTDLLDIVLDRLNCAKAVPKAKDWANLEFATDHLRAALRWMRSTKSIQEPPCGTTDK